MMHGNSNIKFTAEYLGTQTCLSDYVSYKYSRGTGFESWSKHRLFYSVYFGSSEFPPGRCRENVSN